jgi:acetamidase/formamidase
MNRQHVIQADEASAWHLGYFASDAEPLLVARSGDSLSYRSIPSGYGGRSAGVMEVDQAMDLRAEFPEWGPHTVVGPVFVDGAMPGDVLEVRMMGLKPASPAVNLCLPGRLGLGARPDDYPDGFIKRFEFESGAESVSLNDDITIPLGPFPGIIAVQPPDEGRFGTMPPGVFGGNMDLKELTAGSRVFLPVHHVGALLYFGDIHAGQGDGEVNLTALEIGAESLDVEVRLHPGSELPLELPLAESPDHWIALGFGADIESAFQSSLAHVLEFLQKWAGQTADDAYCLASVAVDFRFTQVVSTVKGVHGMIPKRLFGPRITSALNERFGSLA